MHTRKHQYEIKLVIMIALLISIASCNSSDSPEIFAEQAMEAISRGDDKSIKGLDNALVFNGMVKAMLDSVEIPDNLVERYFQIGEIFTQWELIDISEERLIYIPLKT